MDMQKNLLYCALFGLALTWGSGVTAAPNAAERAAVSLAGALESAWLHAPEQALSTGREAEAQALQRHADALLPLAPNLALSGQAGAYNANTPSGTYSEWIAGVELPLWRPGQTEVLRRLAAGTQDLAEAERTVLRLELAGLLREAGWDVWLTEARLHGLQRGLEELQAAAVRVKRAVTLGERARVDAVTLDAEILDVKQQVAAAQLAFTQALAAWRALSRQTAFPGSTEATWREALAGERAVETHPAALAARAMWTRAGNERQAGVLAAEGAPVLGVAARQDRTPGAETLNAVVVTLSMPLPWETARHAAEAPLRYAEIQAEVEFAKQIRALSVARDAARLALQGARSQVTLLEARAKAEQETLRLAQRQVEEGLLDALDFVTVMRRVREAELAAVLGRLEVERAVSRVNQAEGVV